MTQTEEGFHKTNYEFWNRKNYLSLIWWAYPLEPDDLCIGWPATKTLLGKNGSQPLKKLKEK